MRLFNEILKIQETSVEEKIIMIKVQRILESEMIEKHNVHPYSLTLDCIQNCFKGLTAENILKREFK